MKYRACAAAAMGMLWIAAFTGCHRKTAVGSAMDTAGKQQVHIRLQERRNWLFNNGTVAFSNRFAAARAGNVEQLNDSCFMVTVLPENTPVNPSPWYAFRVWASGNRKLFITLNYLKEQHRYPPKVSYDWVNWQEAGPVHFNSDSSKATFAIQAGTDTLTVAGQEILTAADSYRWMDSLAQLPFVQKQIIGYSIQGKPVVALSTNDCAGSAAVVVLSRQHPPEVTGFMAMQQFVETVLGSSAQAQRFRTHYRLLVVPLLNPDGVDEGNWRHSAAGVDLNRDWDQFVQPETRAVRDFLLQKTKDAQLKVYFGIDFHSTYRDVFYTNADTATRVPGFTKRWLQAFGKAIPGFTPNVKPSGNGGNVSKSWMMRALGCDALTYEVGDGTSRELLKMKGRVAAEKMMELLPAE